MYKGVCIFKDGKLILKFKGKQPPEIRKILNDSAVEDERQTAGDE